eukprot:s1078_g12.t1
MVLSGFRFLALLSLASAARHDVQQQRESEQAQVVPRPISRALQKAQRTSDLCSLGPWLLWCITAWLELLMLPQCVLCAPGRGGRRRRKAETAFTLDRLQRWQEGERLSLWESRPRCRATRTGPLTPEERRDIGSSWGREGFDGKACAALLSKGLSPSFQALAALHPHRPLPAVPAIADLPLAPCMAPDLIARCLRAVPAETAPGPSGLRVQHLRDACSAGGTDNFIAQLTAVVDLLAQGRAPAAVAPVLAGRGEGFFGQLRHAGSIDKEVLRQATAFPSLARWATWCYRQPRRSFGPSVVSLALQPLASELRAGSVDLAVHFLDDGVLAGDIAALGAALQLAQRRAADIGLELNLGKCELVVLSNPSAPLLQPHFPAALLQRPDGSSRVLINNFEFLGAAIGDDAYIGEHTAKRAAQAGELLEAVAALEDLQAARGVAQAGLGLRSCLAHAPAAYLASLGASMDACADIDRAFSAAAVRASPSVMGALQTICRDLPADKSVSLDAALAAKQHDLSERLDNASWQVQLAQASLVEKAGLGARVFLAAVPSGRTRLEPAVFSAELRFLGVPDAARDCWCPLCDGVLDRHSHHSATCVGAAAAAYARHKQNHQQTALACGAQGVAFVPMVAEATGTWDSGAAAVIKHVARAVAARAGDEPGPLHFLLLQELCVASGQSGLEEAAGGH